MLHTFISKTWHCDKIKPARYMYFLVVTVANKRLMLLFILYGLGTNRKIEGFFIYNTEGMFKNTNFLYRSEQMKTHNFDIFTYHSTN